MNNQKITNKEELFNSAINYLKSNNMEITCIAMAKQLNISRQRYFVSYSDFIDIQKQIVKEDKLKQIKSIASKSNIKILSTEFDTLKTKLKLKCTNESHPPFFFSSTAIKNGKFGCPLCTTLKGKGRPKHDGLAIAKKIATEKGGVCLSTTYKNKSENLLWHCGNSYHSQWEAPLNNVENLHTWCPECGRRKD